MRLLSKARRRVLAAPFFLTSIAVLTGSCASTGGGGYAATQHDRLYRGVHKHEYPDLVELMIDTAPERDVAIYDDESMVMSMLEELEIRSTYQNEEGTYILAEMAADIPAIPTIMNTGAIPEWVLSTPQFSGYYVAVGSTRRQRLLTTSIYEADKSALSELIMQMLVSVYTREDRATADGGTRSLESTTQTASGVVKGYMVVSRWISPKGDDYYTLAI